MKPRIEWAEIRDRDALVPLMAALHAHDVPEAPAPGRDAILDHLDRLLSPETPHRLLIAWDADGTALGLAALATFVSVSDPRPGNRLQVELKELFVLPEARGSGIGSALMVAVEDHARRIGACRVDWHVKRDNDRGIAFYERWGGRIVSSRLSMRRTL